ncbi:hypothetical protein ACWGH3_28215 [Streptomyces sp. NPDC054884]|uniref:hypothetical protein n=1 Tax=unclassified Streptomyces TaxID=2593676 RepID=UPI0039F65F0E
MREEQHTGRPEEQRADATDVSHTTDAAQGAHTTDAAEVGRRARFGALPERVNPQDLVEERPATPRDPARDAYDPDQVAIRYGL